MSKQISRFIRLESISGLLLILMLLIALLIANSPLQSLHHTIIDIPIQIRVGSLDLHKPLLLWINEGLMAIFFMLLALEMKREIIDGELSKRSQLVLPISAALGGIILPALIYYGFNHADAYALDGWPIVTTTDIAFALGIIALLGRRVPTSLKVFLVALSIVDDILAIAIIAFFFTKALSATSLLLASLGVMGLLILNRAGVMRIAPYILVGIFIWVCVLKSGIHATLTGVIVGLCIPFRGKDSVQPSPLRHLEHMLHPWVAYIILPLFVFANGGVRFMDFAMQDLVSSVSLGIIFGLVVGKTAGVFFSVFILVKTGLARLPAACNWAQLFAISALTGIGFTMSLFLSSLAFHGTTLEVLAKQAVLIGSFIAGTIAVLAFIASSKRNPIAQGRKIL